MPLRPFIIDCDTGRDDALAIWVALAKKLPLAAVVASYGNSVLSNVVDNTARVLALAGREDIPLLGGAVTPLRLHAGYNKIVRPRQDTSGNGLCNLELPRSLRPLPAPSTPEDLAAHLVDLAAQHGPLDYIILGPATNFAALCYVLGKRIRNLVARVTMMGGKFGPLWTSMPAADFNLASDPCAVRILLEHGPPLRFVTMNTTWPVALPLEVIEKLNASSEVGAVTKQLMMAYCRHFAPEPVFRFHDPCVVLAAEDTTGFTDTKLDIVCTEDSPEVGRLIEQENGFPSQIYRSPTQGPQEFLHTLLLNLSLSPVKSAA